MAHYTCLTNLTDHAILQPTAVNCPFDHVQMRQLEDKGILMDWCELCDGIWLDAGELTRLTHTAKDIPALPPEPPERTQRPSRKQPACPRCGFLTETTPYDQDPSLELDRCPRCHGLWLERGELQAIYDGVSAKLAGPQPAAAPATPGDSLAIVFAILVLIAVIGLSAALIGFILTRPKTV